jgi:hypothetical protein
MANNRNCSTFGGHLPYRISMTSVKLFVGYVEKSTSQS